MDTGVVIIGAYGDNSNTGAAYLFQKNTGGANNWGQSKKLIASDPVVSDFFGDAVGVDGGIAVVGARGADAPDPGSGAAYVYEELPAGAPEASGARTTSWKFVKKLVAPDGDSSDKFGYSVSVENGTVLVGAPTDELDGTGQGSAYIFDRNQGGPGAYGFVKKLVAPDADNSDLFGLTVKIDGDIAVVGAPQSGPVGAFTGAAYVYGRNIGGTDNWGFLRRLTAPDTAAGDGLGFAVAVSGDEVLVGANSDDLGPGNGSAHIFRINSICPADLNGDGVVDTADLGILIGSFGESGLGDINLDGVIDTADLGILIGAFGSPDCVFGS